MPDPQLICKVAFKADPGFQYFTEYMADSPAMYLRLGEPSGTNANDETVNNNGGTYQASPTLGVVGALEDDTNTAVTLNGSTQYISVLDSATLDTADVCTLAAWVKRAANGAAHTIFDKGTNAYELRLNAANNIELVQSNVASIVQSTVTVLADNVWHLVVATKNGATVKLYLDGVDVTGTVTNATLANTAVDLHIGHHNTAGQFFNGSLDEPAVFPTAVTQARVQTWFNTGKPWTDLSASVLGFGVQRGRQKELDKVDASRATVRFDNSNRRLDPLHTGSDLYPNVVPMRELKLETIHNGTRRPLYRGFVESWPQSWEGPNVGFSDVTVVDAFLPLSLADIGAGQAWPREFTGARITRILDAAGWPSQKRAIDTGYTEIAAVQFELGQGVTALDALQQAADLDRGVFFTDARGWAVFHDRHHRKQASYLTSQATFADANTSGLPYTHVELETAAQLLANDFQVTASGGTAARAQDTASQKRYFRRTLARTVPFARPEQAQEEADYLLSVFKDPRYRLDAIKVVPRGNDTLWTQVLARDIADHIAVKRWPQKVGSIISQECSVESIQHQATPGGWETTWLLSTGQPTVVDWWLLEDATYGVLDSTTKLVY